MDPIIDSKHIRSPFPEAFDRLEIGLERIAFYLLNLVLTFSFPDPQVEFAFP